MEKKPTTSVIIPVFNGAAFIGEAIASILPQLEPNDEIIVVDDASTDATAELLAAFVPRITVLRGPGEGPSAARNIGIAAAQGEFIAFLDHDDLWPPGRHHALMEALNADPSADAAIGRTRLRMEPGAMPEGLYHRVEGHWAVFLFSYLYRRRLIEAVGLFDVSLRYGEDTDYYFRQVEAGMKPLYCDVDSIIYRRHAGNATNTAPPHESVLLQVLARKLARGRARQPS